MKNVADIFEMTREAKTALNDFFTKLKNLAAKNSVDADSCEDLLSSLDEHINIALRKSCDSKRVEVVDAQMMLEILFSLGTPEELIEGLGSTRAGEVATARSAASEYRFPRQRTLHRSSKDRWLMGVCGGFAEYWGVSSLLLRFLLVFSGIGILAYILIGLIMPPDDCPETEASARPGAIFSGLQTVLKVAFVIFMVVILYMPLSLALLSLAAAGFFKILSEIGIAGWQSNDLWFYFVTGIPGYIAGMASLVAGIGFFALLTQFFATTFFNKSLLNINTRKLVTFVAVSGLLVFASFWMVSSSMRDPVTSDRLMHTFDATKVREIDFAFPGSQMPFFNKTVQVVGDPAATEVKIDVIRKVGGWNESYAAANLESLSYVCQLTDDGKLLLGGDITKPAWSFYPFPEISFQITVPEQQLLKITSNQKSGFSCDMSVSKVAGPVNINLQTGKIRLESLASPEITVSSNVGSIDLIEVKTDRLEATSNVGSIKCSGLTAGEALLKTDVGSIKLENFSIGIARIETQTGSINARTEFIRPGSEMNISSEVGSIKLELPELSKPSLNLICSLGRISNEFESIATDADSPKVQIKSSIGSIKVRKFKGSGKDAKQPVLPAEAPANQN